MPKTLKQLSPDVYSYLRFSSAEQKKGDSIRRQTELRDAWLKKNGLKLTDNSKLVDAGVSAFRGAHRADDRHNLAMFLERVRAGHIARGSYLVVESLDRLSREHIRPALTLLLNLIESGIRIVQLLPVETVYDEKAEPMTLLQAIMELGRGHAESALKSERVGAAYKRKHELAALEGRPMSKTCPAWLENKNGKYVVRPEAAKTVKLIFKLAASGMGVIAIHRELTKRKIPPLTPGRPWVRMRIQTLLTSRKVLGEFQPRKATPTRRIPYGSPVPNYYPAVITQKEWDAARDAIESRSTFRGPRSKKVFILKGLMTDARDGSPMYLQDKGRGAFYVGKGAHLGEPGSVYATFPAEVLEESVLDWCREIDPAEVLDSPAAASLDRARTRRDAVQSRLEKLKAQLTEGDEDVGVLVEAVRKLQSDLAQAQADYDDARRKSESPTAAAWSDFWALTAAVKESKEPDKTRERIRSALRRMTSGIRVLARPGKSHTRMCAVHVQFADAGYGRLYFIFHSPRDTEKFAFAGPALSGQFDLRTKTGVETVGAILERGPDGVRSLIADWVKRLPDGAKKDLRKLLGVTPS